MDLLWNIAVFKVGLLIHNEQVLGDDLDEAIENFSNLGYEVRATPAFAASGNVIGNSTPSSGAAASTTVTAYRNQLSTSGVEL